VSRSVGRAVATGAKALSKAIGWAGRVLGAGLSKIVRAVGDALRMVRKQIGRLLGTAAKRILLLKHLGTFVFGMVKGGVEQVRCSRAGGATPPDLPTPEEMAAGTKAPSPPNDNIVIAVAGIGSSSSEVEGRVVGNASIYQMDFRTLGYSDEKIFHFSYKGLEDRSGAGPYRLHATYTKEDTYKSIVESARQLREQVSAIHGRYPNKQIDLIAHSQGGLVAQYFLTWFYRESNPDDLRIDHFISLASPHFGADAAGLHSALSDNVQGRITLWELNEVARRLGLPPPSSRAAQQLARDSDFIEDLTRSWNPQRVKATTISPTLDWVVAAPHTRLRGAAHYTADLPNMGSILFDHGGFVSTESAKGILYNALADSPSTCTALRNAFADYGPGRLVAEMEGTLVDALDIASHISPAGNIP
jgi:pimeloyl-ACP methyl ester carboxylesterase